MYCVLVKPPLQKWNNLKPLILLSSFYSQNNNIHWVLFWTNHMIYKNLTINRNNIQKSITSTSISHLGLLEKLDTSETLFEINEMRSLPTSSDCGLDLYESGVWKFLSIRDLSEGPPFGECVLLVTLDALDRGRPFGDCVLLFDTLVPVPLSPRLSACKWPSVLSAPNCQDFLLYESKTIIPLLFSITWKQLEQMNIENNGALFKRSVLKCATNICQDDRRPTMYS